MRAKTIGELIPTSVASAAAPTTSADERVKELEEQMAKALAEKDAEKDAALAEKDAALAENAAEKDAALAALDALRAPVARNLDTGATIAISDVNAVVLPHTRSATSPQKPDSVMSRMWKSMRKLSRKRATST